MENVDLSCINYASDEVVQKIGGEAVDIYRFIVERFNNVDPYCDALFKFVFKNAYRMENAGLTDEFKERFFYLFGEAKKVGRVDIEYVVRDLYTIPNRKGLSSLQFSFVTKMANTVDRSYPIYDKEVASFFGFRAPYHN